MEKKNLTDYNDEDFVNSKELSDILNVKVLTLGTWRKRGIGPAFLKAGNKTGKGSVRYQIKNVKSWIQDQG